MLCQFSIGFWLTIGLLFQDKFGLISNLDFTTSPFPSSWPFISYPSPILSLSLGQTHTRYRSSYQLSYQPRPYNPILIIGICITPNVRFRNGVCHLIQYLLSVKSSLSSWCVLLLTVFNTARSNIIPSIIICPSLLMNTLLPQPYLRGRSSFQEIHLA